MAHETTKTLFTTKIGDERLLAAVSHFGLFIAPVLLPLIIWLWERGKAQPSQYMVDQARQAVIYQTFFMVVCIGLGGFLALFSYWLVGWTFLPAYVMVLFAACVYAAFGGYQCFIGKEFRYYLPIDKDGEIQL